MYDLGLSSAFGKKFFLKSSIFIPDEFGGNKLYS
jgi:hypothetical protein